MKTLTLITLMLVMCVSPLLSSSDNNESTCAPVSPPDSTCPTDLDSSIEIAVLSNAGTNSSELSKKEYHIYFENRSEEALKVAIRYKDYNGDWQTEGFVNLEAGEKRHMGVSDQKTYFYYAENQKKWKKKKWTGNYSFPVKESDLNKLRFVKQDIWECYDTKMCNTFAVFR